MSHDVNVVVMLAMKPINETQLLQSVIIAKHKKKNPTVSAELEKKHDMLPDCPPRCPPSSDTKWLAARSVLQLVDAHDALACAVALSQLSLTPSSNLSDDDQEEA